MNSGLGSESALGKAKGFPQRLRRKLLENRIHIHQKPGRPYRAPAGLKSAVPQDQPRQLHHSPAVFVEPVKPHGRDGGCRKLNRRYILKHRRQPAQAAARLAGAQAGPPQPPRRRLHQPVGQNVLGEFVVPHRHRQRHPEPPPQLFVKPDAPAHGVQRLLFGPVAVRQAARKGPPRLPRQRYGQRIRQRVLLGKIEILFPKTNLANGVASQRQNLRNAYFRLNQHRQAVHRNGADCGTGRQNVGAIGPRRRFYAGHACCQQRITLSDGKRNRPTAPVFL